MFEFFKVTVSPLRQNCYVLFCPQSREAALIDAGDEPERILLELQKRDLNPKMLINTHCHADHVSAVAVLQEQLSLPFYAHQREEMILAGLLASQSYYGFGDGRMPKVTKYLSEGDQVALGSGYIEVIETPGHTPGGVCLKADMDLFTGDTLFAGSIGRSDLPGGDSYKLMESLKTKLMPLDPNLRVHSGHGLSTTIGTEKATNPFLLRLA